MPPPVKPCPSRRAVVVGVDGSPASGAAVDWGLRAAVLHDRPLRIVHAVDRRQVAPQPGQAHRDADPAPLGPARALVAEAASRARGQAPDHPIETALGAGGAAPTLVAESRLAELVVVGHRGVGGFTGLLLGSVGLQVAMHADSPVTVVRTAVTPPDGRVVVGVDGSADSDLAIGFAFEEAALRGMGLTAVHAAFAACPGAEEVLQLDVEECSAEDARPLIEALGGWQQKYPHVDVCHRVVYRSPGRALVRAAGGDDLLVVGARGRGGFGGMLLGSATQIALHYATCTVAIVRRPREAA